MGGVEIVGRAHFGGADIPHRNASPQIFQQNALFLSAQQSTQAQVVGASTAIPQKTVVMDFLSDKAREILRQTGQEPGDPGIEHRLWSSLNESQLRQNPSGSQGLNRSLQNAQAREDSTYLSYPRSSGYNEEFVRKMDEESAEQHDRDLQDSPPAIAAATAAAAPASAVASVAAEPAPALVLAKASSPAGTGAKGDY